MTLLQNVLLVDGSYNIGTKTLRVRNLRYDKSHLTKNSYLVGLEFAEKITCILSYKNLMD